METTTPPASYSATGRVLQTLGQEDWTFISPTPFPSTSNHGSAVVDGLLYVIGGNSRITDRTAVYDPDTDTWSAEAPMPLGPRTYLACAAVGTTIYAIGGSTNASGSGHLDRVEAYDTLTDTWSTRAPLPGGPRQRLVAAEVGGKVYAIAGWDGSYLGTVEEYDPVSDTWVSKSGLPSARYWPACAVLDGLIYVLGGYRGFDEPSVYTYDPVADQWQYRGEMPIALKRSGAVALNGHIHLYGGSQLSTNSRAVLEYSPSAEIWIEKSLAPTARAGHSMNVIDGVAYIVPNMRYEARNMLLELFQKD